MLLSATDVAGAFYPDLIRVSPVHGQNQSPGYTSPSQVGGLSPNVVRGAYGLGPIGSSTVTFGGVQGDGTGQTIAVVDAYNDPDIVSDLQTFDAGEGIANPPSITVVGQTGSTTSLPANGPTSGSNDWSGEESLDVEWAHVIAPGASILVVECTSNAGTYLEQGDAIAAAYNGVAVVSNSYGGGESSGESTSLDPYFTTPSGHSGVSFFASTGDSGGEVAYPAVSPNVVAVGGTQLTVSGSNWSSETAWTDGGGGTSSYESQPTFQAGTITATKREVPDISIAGGQNSGSSNCYVPVYDSYDSEAWEGVEGTSWSSPMVAAMVAIADQGRVAEGLTPLVTVTGSDAVDTRLYQLSKANFHDITTGSNGSHSAVAGYDEATGIGTPIASAFIPDLAGAKTITGQAFVDNGGNGIYGGNDTPIAGQTVYLDLNNDGSLDNGEPSTTTNAQGYYTFTDEPAGGVVRMSSAAPAGYTLTSASSASITYGATDTVNFTYKAVPSKVVFSQQPPASTPYGTTLSPIVVNVENSVNSTVLSDGSTVTLTLSSGTFSSGSSTATATAVNGVATFNSLKTTNAGTYTITASDGSLTTGISNSFVITQATPTVSWTNPSSITYGTALSSTQLNATASVPGTFLYTPAAGTVLGAGAGQSLGVVFTPTDSTDYTTATGSVTITVSKATPTVSWSTPASITYGTTLSGIQLDATANIAGAFVYTPGAGTLLGAGVGQDLSVAFTPTDSTDYTTANGSTTITVLKATPIVGWNNPASITYGTALSATQLDATASVPGTFFYTPAAGTVLGAGAGQSLGVAFTPTDSTDYTTATGSASITVLKATPTVTWNNPAAITYGTALSATQLDATANVPGAYVYTPAAGTVLGAGAGQSLGVAFTPTDSTDYTTATGSASITVLKATPVISWANPAPISSGTPLSGTQLDATASVPGAFIYTPPSGTILSPGANQTLSTAFTPTDSTDYTTASASVLITVNGVTKQPINLTGSTFYVKLDSSSPANLDIWTNSTAAGTPALVTEFDTISSVTLSANAVDDSFTADFSNGTVVPAGGLTFNGFGTAASNSLIVVGTQSADTVTVPGDGNFHLNSQTVAYSAATIGNVYFKSPGIGEQLTVPSGTVTIAPGTGPGITTEVFTSITVGANAELAIPQAATQGQRLLVQTGSLSIAGSAGGWTGTVDLSDNDLDVANGSLSNISSQLAQGLGTGVGGIISSAASNDPTALTTLGAIQNSVDGTISGAPLYGSGAPLGTFDGANPASTDVLVKYTYYGDANLDGAVDGSDYTLVDNGFNNALSGWVNGDFNYDGVVNGSDYTLIDNAFNTQGASLAAQIAPPAKASAVVGLAAAKPTPVFSTAQSASAQTNWIAPSDVANEIFGSASSRLPGSSKTVFSTGSPVAATILD